MARSLRTWLGVCLLLAASEMMVVPPPEKLRVHSVNFKNILLWETPTFPGGNLTFTVQYLSYQKLFQDLCKHTKATECNFSNVSKYGHHTLRVRTEFGAEHSDWVNITFYPLSETTIGPPGMQVDALSSSMHIRFLAPLSEKEPETWTMKNFYSNWTYNLQYWKNGSDEKSLITCQYDSEVLKNLDPRSTYCLRARVFLPYSNKTGAWSEPICQQTKEDDTISFWVIALVVIGASACMVLLLLGCLVLLWCIYKKTKYAFAPGNVLPQHLKEFLGYPPHSPLGFFTFPPSDENEVFDKLSVVTPNTGPLLPNGQSSPGPFSEGNTQADGSGDSLLTGTLELDQTQMRVETI
ncbi:interleukin-10 receptor subunit beta [Suncus etruscus]|uniref:interleukin-10 receptor subunit beta n=1 Tax=Suncus etruscus TaxID=109475 RepID=UPI0021108564|nr:interleukin-10 receptor subunit beta [Suncus etruscus]